jgi:hypothetical protein
MFLTIFLALILCFPGHLIAQQQPSHVVSLEELRTALVSRSVERAANVQEVQKLLRHDEVQKRFGALADLGKIEQALPTLDDETLRQLAADSQKVNDQLQAGLATWGWVVIALVAVVAVIIIVGVNSGPDEITVNFP